MHRRAFLAGAATAAVVSGIGSKVGAQDQNWPDRPIKFVVPYPPGGGVDTVSRIVVDAMNASMPQRFIIENRGGANGTTGSDLVARSAPDGYTLLAMAPGPITIAPHFQPTPYDSLKDFTPVAMLSYSPFLMVTTNSLPTKTLSEVIAHIKANPGKVRFASTGIGSSAHLAGEMFSKAIGTKMIHVPYSGTGPALPDLIAGRVEFMINSNDSLWPLAKDGQVRGIASASKTRPEAIPDLPTFAEAGMKGFEIGTWVGIGAPAGMPKPIVDKLYGYIERTMKSLEAKKPFAGAEVRLLSPGELAEYIREENEKVRSVVSGLDLPKQ